MAAVPAHNGWVSNQHRHCSHLVVTGQRLEQPQTKQPDTVNEYVRAPAVVGVQHKPRTQYHATGITYMNSESHSTAAIVRTPPLMFFGVP